MKPKYIDAGAAEKVVMAANWENGADGARAMAIIATAPAVDVEPVRHGRWEDYWGGKYSDPLYVCSECHKPALLVRDLDDVYFETMKQRRTQFCPHCGAKMDKEDKDNDK